MRRVLALSVFVFVAGSSTVALADEVPSRSKKGKKSGCSVAEEDDAMLGLAVFVLLVSGAALRRRGDRL